MKSWLKIAGYVTLTIMMGGTLYFAIGRPVQVLPLLDPVPLFELVDHRGDTYFSHERGQKLTLYTVGAARDHAALEQTMAQLTSISNDLEARGWSDDVEIVLISVDPEHDDPAVLRSIAERYPLFDRPSTYLLTGPWVIVKLAAGSGMRIYFEDPIETENDVTFVYDRTLVLVDNQGVLRARYDVHQVDPETLARDIRLLSDEANAEGTARLAYQAAHLFLCYP